MEDKADDFESPRSRVCQKMWHLPWNVHCWYWSFYLIKDRPLEVLVTIKQKVRAFDCKNSKRIPAHFYRKRNSSAICRFISTWKKLSCKPFEMHEIGIIPRFIDMTPEASFFSLAMGRLCETVENCFRSRFGVAFGHIWKTVHSMCSVHFVKIPTPFNQRIRKWLIPPFDSSENII